MSSTVKKPLPAEHRINNSSMKQQHGNISSNNNSMKQQSQGSSSSGSKPNAWSKPLQGAAKKGPPASTGKTSKAPPGLSKQHSEKTSANLTALRERYLHLLLTLTGQKVTVTLKSGTEYTGVLHAATPFAHLEESQRHKYVLKAVSVSGEEDSTVKPGQTVLLNMESVVQLHVKSCRLDALVTAKNNADAFTDTEISGVVADAYGKGNDLVQADATWTSAGETINSRAAKLAAGGAPGTGALKGSIAGWDQFKANEELFNVVGSYDETVYTTILDHSQISEQARQRAEQLAREIEGAASTNLHIAEERGQVMNQDYDEEDRYSGVLKTAATAKPKLNYAQVVTASKADPAPPGFGSSDSTIAPTENSAKEIESAKKESKPESEATSEKEEPEPKMEEGKATEKPAEEKPDEAAKTEIEETDVKPAETKSKLSATAKSFSFNINAKTFTPTVIQHPPPPPPPPLYNIDPVTGMPMMMAMGGPMMPTAMMPPMMNPGQYPGMRYPGHYPGMEHLQHPMPHMHPMQQPLPPPVAAATSRSSDASSPASVSEEGSVTQQPQPQEGDGASSETSSLAPQHRPPPPPPQQQQHPMQMQPHMYYPGGYYNPAMGMHQHHPQQFMYPQMAAHMQRQMYPMQAGMAPNMMRVPPYYPGPNGPMPYPPYGGVGVYGEEDGMLYGGRGGRGGRSTGRGGGRTARGQGRGGTGGRMGGGGRGRYNHQYSGGSSSQGGDSGRETPQDQPQAGESAPPGEEGARPPKSEGPAPSETSGPPPAVAVPAEDAGGK